jgi:hypothetical protein
MELAPFNLGDDDDGVVSPIPEVSTAPFDARAPESMGGALPLVEVNRDVTEKLRIGATRTLALSRVMVVAIGAAAFVTGLLTALAFSPPARRSPQSMTFLAGAMPAAPPAPVVEPLPAPAAELPQPPVRSEPARSEPARPVRRVRPPAPAPAPAPARPWADPFAN